jgi:voltage-gated potassium channel
MTILHLIEKAFLFITKVSWRALIFAFLGLYFGTWFLVATFEGDAPIAKGANYWWYFIVTVTTTGYGDLFPTQPGSRIAGAIAMFGGIGLFSALLAKVAEIIFQIIQKRKKGLLKLHMENHILILGYQKGRTQALVTEILADTPDEGEKIVLCAPLEENPVRELNVEFVQGNPSHDAVLKKACINQARRVIIYGHDDNETVAIALAVNHQTNSSAHVAVFIRENENAINIHRINPRFECVTSLAVQMLVHAILDPGSTAVIGNLVCNSDPGTSYRLNIPDSFPETYFGDLQCNAKTQLEITIIGMSNSHEHDAKPILNPPKATVVKGGMSIHYIADSRLNDKVIDWNKLLKLL